MGYRGLDLTIIAVSCFIASVGSDSARAAGAGGAVLQAEPYLSSARIGTPVLHRHRTQSFYCYPKNYWWFYRPYTTAPAGYARCMPYFHYLEPGGRDARRSIK